MPFLIQGSVHETFISFGKDEFIGSGAERRAITVDIPRTHFFGTAEQNDQHVEIWSDPEQTPAGSYTQGNMSAGNLFHLFGNAFPTSFFTPEEIEDPFFYENKYSQIRLITFAYIDQSGNPRGLLLYYRQDNPSKWIIGQSINGNKSPEEAQVKILTSFDPRPFKVKETSCEIRNASLDAPDFISALDLPSLEHFIHHIIEDDGKIKPAAALIKLFLQNVNTENKFIPNKPLLEIFAANMEAVLENELLALLFKLQQSPTPQQLEKCFDVHSDLYSLLSAYVLTGDSHIDYRQISTLLFLDSCHLNNRQGAIRADNHFVEILSSLRITCDHAFLANSLESELKTKSLRFLTQITTGGRHRDFAEQLSQSESEDIWDSLAVLADLEWSFPKDEFRHAAICQILLKSPQLSTAHLLHLLEQLSSPLLAIAYRPEKLADFVTKTAREENYSESLLRAETYFKRILDSEPEFEFESDDELDSLELIHNTEERPKEIFQALKYLKKVAPDNERACQLAMLDDTKGYDFRLLLKQPQVSNNPMMIEFLRKGIAGSRIKPVSQTHANELLEPQTRHYVYRLDESLVVINRLRNLEFDDKVIRFLVKNDVKSRYFCQVVLKIEAETTAIRNRLQREHPEKLRQLENGPEKAYRRDLYQAMYETLHQDFASSEEIRNELVRKIQNAEAHIDQIVHIDQHPWLRKAKQIIANLVMGLLSVVTLGAVGVAFYLHHERTGDWSFFARPTSAEDYRALNREALSETAEFIENFAPAL